MRQAERPNRVSDARSEKVIGGGARLDDESLQQAKGRERTTHEHKWAEILHALRARRLTYLAEFTDSMIDLCA